MLAGNRPRHQGTPLTRLRCGCLLLPAAGLSAGDAEGGSDLD